MNGLTNARAGGDRERNGRVDRALPIDTAGAPASRRGVIATLLEDVSCRGAGSQSNAAQWHGSWSGGGRQSGGKAAPEEGVLSPPPPPQAELPEWVQLIPPGAFRGRDGRGPYVLDDPAAVIAATCALRMEAGIPIDYDHATDLAAPDGRPAPAAGWIKELHERGGALWGRVEWTARAARAIASHEYRYLSPVFQHAPDGKVVRLLRAGLTNNPNLYLTAISAAGDEDGKMDEFLNQLRVILGLGPDASVDEVLERIKAVAAHNHCANQNAAAVNSAAPDPARYVAVAEFQKAITELNALKAERVREKAEHAVDGAIRAGKLVPAQREWAISYCAADPDGFVAFTARQPAILTGEMNLSGDPRVGPPRTGAGLSATESAICSQLGVSAADYAARRSGRADFLRLNSEALSR